MNEPLAIVGMACRYPDARTPSELWESVLAQRRAFRPMPPERLRLADYPTDRSDPDGIYATEAAVIEGYEFDRQRFRVVGSTYRSADLAHWLALDVAADALADAGFPEGRGLPLAMTGVLLGNSLTGEFSRANLMRLRWPYVRRVVESGLAEEGWSPEQRGAFLARLELSYKEPFPPMTEESLAGGLSNTIAGRICNHFDLKGGGYTVDGACSSSLLAVCQAASALRSGDLDIALAGGVDLSLDPFELVGFSRAGALAEGEMRVYDLRSAGFVPGEGCGFVVLMRQDDALAQGRRIYAQIHGWGISSDGHGGISRPEAEGQKLALQRAYRRAGFGIGTVAYFEGHGTGTSVGDATELRALGLALQAGDPPARETGVPPAALGSVKANIGHTKAAAGVAGLIKATLAVHHQVLPPTTGCEEPHAELTSQAARLRVLAQPEIWPADRPLRAAVSAMGFGGINSHVVLESAGAPRRRALGTAERRLAASAQDAELLLLAAGDAAELRSRLEQLAAKAPLLSRAELADLAAELGRRLEGRREENTWRAAMVASRPQELPDKLATLLAWLAAGVTARLDPRRGLFLGTGARPPRIGFLFPGQGSPAHLSGGALRRRFATLAKLYEQTALPSTGDGVDTAVAQPAIVAHSLAGLRCLEMLGVGAEVAIGHSLGEITALHWAGACDEAALLRIATARGRAMADLGSPTGAMATIAAGPRIVGELLEQGVVIAAFNAPESTVVSGEARAVEAIVARARARGLEASRLHVSHAFHSPLVGAVAGRLAEELASEAFAPLSRRVASTVEGCVLPPEADLPALLLTQVTAPVRFTAALEAARGEVDLWLEVGPGRALTTLVDGFLDIPAIALDAGGPSLKGLLEAVAGAFALGVRITPAALFADRFTRPYDLERRPRFFTNPCEMAPRSSVPVQPAREAVALAENRQGDTAAAGIDGMASATGSASPLTLLRELVAQRAELPAAAVQEDSRLLADLHLNSISVGQIVAEAARRLGLPAPTSLSDYAQATVAEVAGALGESLRADGEGSAAAPAPEQPPGVDTWVRAFTVELVARPAPPVPPPSEQAAPGRWQVIAPAGHPLASSLAEELAKVGGDGVAVCLPSDVDERHVGLLLEAAQALLSRAGPARFVLVQQDGGGGGFARTLHLERAETTTCVIDLPGDHPRAAEWAAAEAATASPGYTEVHYDAAGNRRVPVLRPLAQTPGPPGPALGPRDVLLVSGGGKGIVAECAFSLAMATGARLALLGRSLPAASPELQANLERFRAAGVEVCYAAADVADPSAVGAAVAELARELGPITGILHGAGTNEPRLLESLDAAAFTRTLAPKVHGAANLLSAVDPDRLKLFVAFGSIIAETGMRGEADYALANEWLVRWTEHLQRERPACRCLVLEWSVWAGLGMGERLGRLEALIRQGISPIPPDTGVEIFRHLIAHPPDTVAVVVAGRFGTPPTLEVERPELPLQRFLEDVRVYYPGVELVVDCELSADSDPYLEDHVFRGDRLLPAVLGLEAMAQAVMVVTGSRRPPVFEDVELQRPVVVPRQGKTTIRVAALVRAPDRVEVVLRSASTGFQVDHFRTVCRPAGTEDDGPTPASVTLPVENGDTVDLRPLTDLYGGLLFHGGRFRRISGYRQLRATECLADISPDGATSWFGRYLPKELSLGDPAVRDAAIHGLQACIPHTTVLPIGIERIERMSSARIETTKPYRMAARERERQGDVFVYDLEIRDAEGNLIERWKGLRLRAVDRAPAPSTWPVALLGPFVERRLEELIPGRAPRVMLERTVDLTMDPTIGPTTGPTMGSRREASDRALRHLLGGGQDRIAIHRRPDGKPEAPGGRPISVAHAGDLVLAVAADGRVGCDLEPVVARDEQVWRDLLETERFSLAQLIARESGEEIAAAATRVWAASECLTKAGIAHRAPLVLVSTTADGWSLLRSGEEEIGTLIVAVRELVPPLALAVSLGGDHAGL